MSRRDIYTVAYTAIVSGRATYAIPEGAKIHHFVDGGSEITWDFATVRDFEVGDAIYLYTDADGDDEGPTAEVAETQSGDDIPF